VCRVLKPDLSIYATLPMSEVSTPGFNGVYSAEITPSLSEPEGEWLVRVISPSENVMSDTRIHFEVGASTSITKEYIASAVWDALSSMYSTAGSFAEILERLSKISNAIGGLDMEIQTASTDMVAEADEGDL
jgi:hypothetical protein